MMMKAGWEGDKERIGKDEKSSTVVGERLRG
jgi:hypothetical protein